MEEVKYNLEARKGETESGIAEFPKECCSFGGALGPEALPKP